MFCGEVLLQSLDRQSGSNETAEIYWAITFETNVFTKSVPRVVEEPLCAVGYEQCLQAMNSASCTRLGRCLQCFIKIKFLE